MRGIPGEGALVLRFDKKGAIQAFAKGHEASLQESCDRPSRNSDDEDEDEDEDEDSEDEEEDDGEEYEGLDETDRKEREKERQRQREERQKEREERAKAKEREREERRKKKEQEDEENDLNKWLEESWRGLQPPFFSSVKYQLHSKGRRRWCTGGGACTRWQEDMEW